MPLLVAVVAPHNPAPAAKITAPVAPKAEPIVWSATRRLTIADFQGKATPKEKLAALTAADIKAGAACRDYVFTGKVEATFDPGASWFRDPQNSTEALLRHEQLHFDITELYARKLRQKLTVFKMKVDCNKLQPAFDNLTRGVYAEWGREESRYDQETNHGLNTAKQGYWERQVQIKLDQLKEFAI